MTFYIALTIGIIAAFLSGLSVINIPFYEYVLYSLLAIGLYGSIYGIDLKEFKEHRKTIISAVTFGVVLKGLLIGTVLWFFLKSPLAFLLGMIVAQIDPLSVSYLVDKKSGQFSSGGRTVLRAWSSFDDPMTVLFSLYIFLPLALGAALNLEAYGVQLALNLLFAAGFFVLNRVVPSWILVPLAFLVAVPFQLMLGIALCGLFLRPQLKFLPQTINGAFIAAAFILGSLVPFDLNLLILGVALGITTFVAQVVAAFIVAQGLSKMDKLFLAIAQYNGITSAILALVIGINFPEVIPTVATAIVVINALYYGSNLVLEKHLATRTPQQVP